jgi:hypothetical protein
VFQATGGRLPSSTHTASAGQTETQVFRESHRRPASPFGCERPAPRSPSPRRRRRHRHIRHHPAVAPDTRRQEILRIDDATARSSTHQSRTLPRWWFTWRTRTRRGLDAYPRWGEASWPRRRSQHNQRRFSSITASSLATAPIDRRAVAKTVGLLSSLAFLAFGDDGDSRRSDGWISS